MTSWEKPKTTFLEDFEAGIERIRNVKIRPLKIGHPKICYIIPPKQWKEFLTHYSKEQLNRFGLYKDQIIIEKPKYTSPFIIGWNGNE